MLFTYVTDQHQSNNNNISTVSTYMDESCNTDMLALRVQQRKCDDDDWVVGCLSQS